MKIKILSIINILTFIMLFDIGSFEKNNLKQQFDSNHIMKIHIVNNNNDNLPPKVGITTNDFHGVKQEAQLASFASDRDSIPSVHPLVVNVILNHIQTNNKTYTYFPYLT